MLFVLCMVGQGGVGHCSKLLVFNAVQLVIVRVLFSTLVEF